MGHARDSCTTNLDVDVLNQNPSEEEEQCQSASENVPHMDKIRIGQESSTINNNNSKRQCANSNKTTTLATSSDHNQTCGGRKDDLQSPFEGGGHRPRSRAAGAGAADEDQAELAHAADFANRSRGGREEATEISQHRERRQ